jgi:hypothetical protein
MISSIEVGTSQHMPVGIVSHNESHNKQLADLDEAWMDQAWMGMPPVGFTDIYLTDSTAIAKQQQQQPLPKNLSKIPRLKGI